MHKGYECSKILTTQKVKEKAKMSTSKRGARQYNQTVLCFLPFLVDNKELSIYNAIGSISK